MRVDETPAGDASGRKCPHAEQNRQQPIDGFEVVLAGGSPQTGVVYTAGPAGPVGPCETSPLSFEEIQEPLEHSVLIYADPAVQHAAVGTLSPSDCYPAGPAGPCVAGGPVGPDDYLQVLEPFEQLVLDHADPAGQHAVIQDTVDSLEHPRRLPDATLDGRLMEGTTYLEHSALGVSLDSGLMEWTSSPEPLEQSVLNTLLVARPTEGSTETKPPERSALALQLDDGHLNWELLARPMVDVALDRRPMKGLAVPLPVQSLGLAMAPSSEHMEPLSVSRPLEHSVMDIKLGIDKLDVHDGPLFGSDRGWSCLDITDAMRREALRIQSTGRISNNNSYSLIFSPNQNYICEEEISLAEVNSEGL